MSLKSLPYQSSIFQQIKSLPIEDILNAYGVELHNNGGSRLSTLCIFHAEHTPSCVVYPASNSFYCFACSHGGDAVTFITRLLNIKPIDAARDIARRFGLLVDMPDRITPAQRRQAEEAASLHQLEQGFRAWCDRAYLTAAFWFRSINEALNGFDDYCQYAGLVHSLPVIGNHLDVLQFGADDDRIALYQERRRHPWL